MRALQKAMQSSNVRPYTQLSGHDYIHLWCIWSIARLLICVLCSCHISCFTDHLEPGKHQQPWL